MGLNTALAGKEYPSKSYEVTAEAIRKYAEATNEDNPFFTTEDPPLAPPAFLVVPAAESLREAMVDEELGADLSRLVHLEQEHIFHVPIKAGDVLEVKASLEEVETPDTGHFFTVKMDLNNEGGQLAAEAKSKMFIRKSGSGGRAPKGEDEKEPVYILETPEKVDENQTYRYAEASGDDNPIHVDPEYARDTAQLPGIILQGMCTMAFAAKAVLNGVGGADPSRLRKIKVSFARPAFPGQTLTTRIWRKDDDGLKSVYGFDTVNPSGGTVIKDGIAEITY
ncbi:MAG TPA: MaoC/PaaZ C-terminal domain-containing protein [Actinomycetota bacterium]|jgi:acyl dehydratase|nr:MaoC/PaaZ C-terminal domain-containing protein [Actinomycetota bacterium]